MTNMNAVAYLIAYTPQGTMEFRTTSYEQVYEFKKTCKQIGCNYSVRFRKVETNDESHVVKTRGIVKAAKDFWHWFCLR